MPEIRQDVVTGRWVVVATERAMRPSDFGSTRVSAAPEPHQCPFCPGRELMTPLELYAVRPADCEPNTPGWQVRVVPNKFPAFKTGELEQPSESMFSRRAADGSHEVIIHTPDHTACLATMPVGDVELVLRVYRQRYRANRDDPHVRYAHIVVNHGKEAGASIEHTHSQLFGVPLVPPLVQQELAGASWHHTSRGKCVFCRIMEAELEVGRRVIVENDSFVAIAPFASCLPFEMWIIPREHQPSFDMIEGEQFGDFAQILHDTLGRYRERFDSPPYNYYIHSAPTDGSDYPYYHWHLELIPKLTWPGAFEMGTSMMINVTTPEHAAEFLRDSHSVG
ncbi:MAG: galactose-1-phosphate uridylyltransferase [Actinobacteria bacterium]|nr:galactose-1-phosphate uridylyltransferase [Actinomycetota bacterium]MBU4385907.1 galactose-1-phosphate uridylyltransferase [Actinomycetota bacterium]MCG2795074.1 galactose-1-phosphate uridylyltransferase [Actinomycetes bacterium]